MSSIAIVVDSTPGLSQDYVERHGIRVVPLYLKIGDKTYRDGVDITEDEFYSLLPKADPLPTTSQPSAGDFAKVYDELVAEGATGIVSVHLSSGISGTVNSANLAAQQLSEVPVRVVDTLYAAAAHVFVIEAGVRARAAGADLDGIVEAMQRVIDQVKLVFMVETLEYLYKGGRIGGAAALVGSLLQFKPLLFLDDGRIDALERVRTSKRALVRMVEVVGEWLGRDEPLAVVVMHAHCPETAAALAAHLPKALNVVNVRTCHIPPVLGAHVGNGTVGLGACPVSLLGGSLEDSAI